MSIKHFLITSRNVDRSSTIWNASASLASSFQSVLLLVLVSIFLGDVQAGVFSIATAQSYLFLTIALFGMRRYQSSDVDHHFSYWEYATSRVLSCGAMVLVGAVTCVVLLVTGDYTVDKVIVVLICTLLRVPDAMEDMYQGYFQLSGRLDVSTKISTVRMIVSTLAFVVPIVLGSSLVVALAAQLIVSAGCLAILVRMVLSDFVDSTAKQGKIGNVFRLFRTCLPIFITGFLSIYIYNAPKYGIDAVLDDQAQARYNYLSMPSYVIQMLSLFIFNPMIFKMSTAWSQSRTSDLAKMVWTVVAWIAGITVACLVGGALIGLPILSWLYQTDLNSFLWQFLILLLSGGFVALVGLLTTTLTIMRYHRLLVVGYIASAALALTSSWWIRWGNLMGACLLYGTLIVLQCIVFIPITVYGIRRRRIEAEK